MSFFSEIFNVNFISLTAYIMISYVPPSFNSREKNRQTSCKWKWSGRLRPVWLICSIKWVRFQNQPDLNHLKKCSKFTIVKIKSRSHFQVFNLRLPKGMYLLYPRKEKTTHFFIYYTLFQSNNVKGQCVFSSLYRYRLRIYYNRKLIARFPRGKRSIQN